MSYKIKQTNESVNCDTVTQIQRLDEQVPYYAETAYTPDKVDTLDATWGLEQFSSAGRGPRKISLSREKYCAHIMPGIGDNAIKFFHLYGENKFKKKFDNKKNHEEYIWLNRNSEWFQLNRLALLMTIIAVVAVIVINIYRIEKTPIGSGTFLIFILPLVFYFYTYIKAYTLTKKNNYVFNRRTGLVSIPQKENSTFVCPFYELNPYCNYTPRAIRSASWYLYLGHREKPIGIRVPNRSKNPATVHADWTFIQWFMDVSLPLPDLPQFELYRHLDPTSAAYDKKTKRPKRYWLELPFSTIKQVYHNEVQRLHDFDAFNERSWKVVSDDYQQWPNINKLGNNYRAGNSTVDSLRKESSYFKIKKTSHVTKIKNNLDTVLKHQTRKYSSKDYYYADTAYTPEKYDALGWPLDINRFNYDERIRRPFTLPKGKICPHILPVKETSLIDLFSDMSAIDLFNEGGEQCYKEKIGGRKIWEELTQSAGDSPKEWWKLLKWFTLFLSIVFIISFTPVVLFNFTEFMSEPGLLLMPLTSVLLFFFSRYTEKISVDNNKIKFNRRTGLLSIPRAGKPAFSRPFYEFIPYYYNYSSTSSINTYVSTYFAHRDHAIGVSIGGTDFKGAFIKWAFIKWSFLQLFMDVSLPLPDVPEFEPYRYLDPTTAAYDKKTGRPEHYWRDMNHYKAKKFYSNESDRLNKFDTNNSYLWCPVSDNYMQWPHLVELEPLKDTYEDNDEYFDLLDEKKKKKKLEEQRPKQK